MTVQSKCHRCGRRVTADARYCPYCGIGSPWRPTFLSQREALIALAVTFSWVVLTLFAKTYDLSFPLVLFLAGLLLPLVVPICLATYWTWLQRSSTRLSFRPLHPAVVLVVTLAWFWVSLLLTSDPGENNIMLFAWFGFTASLALSWFAIAASAIQIIGASAWTAVRRTIWITIYLVPLPAAAYLVALLAGQEYLPLKARFELSEAAFDRAVIERPLTSLRVGLFQVSKIEDVESCVFLETGGVVLADGFAYCPDGRPSRAMRDSPPDILMYPLNGDWQNAAWWKYEIVESSY